MLLLESLHRTKGELQLVHSKTTTKSPSESQINLSEQFGVAQTKDRTEYYPNQQENLEND